MEVERSMKMIGSLLGDTAMMGGVDTRFFDFVVLDAKNKILLQRIKEDDLPKRSMQRLNLLIVVLKIHLFTPMNQVMVLLSWCWNSLELQLGMFLVPKKGECEKEHTNQEVYKLWIDA